MMQLQRCLNKHKRRVLWPRHFVVGHNGHYSHNPRVVTVVTVVSGGRFLVPGHNPRVVTSHQRAICYPSKKEGKDDIKGGLVPPIHNPPAESRWCGFHDIQRSGVRNDTGKKNRYP
eukprot:scaffold11689_cov172-Skeletonema_marinoi.AAC.1